MEPQRRREVFCLGWMDVLEEDVLFVLVFANQQQVCQTNMYYIETSDDSNLLVGSTPGGYLHSEGFLLSQESFR